MDASPSERQFVEELTPLLRTPDISAFPEIELSPSVQSLHSRLGVLRDESCASSRNASPVLKRARFESPEPFPEISSDFLTRKLREANEGGVGVSYSQPSYTQPSPPSSGFGGRARGSPVPRSSSDLDTHLRSRPDSRSGTLDSILIVKQTEINDLKAQTQRIEQKSARKLEELRSQLEQERKYGQEQARRLENKLKSAQDDAQLAASRAELDLKNLRAELHSHKAEIGEYETRVSHLTLEIESKDAECAKLNEKVASANVRASRLETRVNELDAVVRNACNQMETAQDKEMSARLRCDEAQSLKNGLLQQISHLESKLETVEEQHAVAIDEKQTEVDQLRLKLHEREKELKSAKDAINIFKAAEAKLSQENEDLHKLIADEKVQTSRSEARLRSAKGEIAELKEQILDNSMVRDLRRQLDAQQTELERASGILEERNQRIKSLEQELSESGRSAEFARMHSELENRNQEIQGLHKTISELKSKQRQEYITQSSIKTQLESLKEELSERDQALREALQKIEQLEFHAESNSKQLSKVKQEYEKLEGNYKRVYSDYLAEIQKVREQAQTEIQKVREEAQTELEHMQQAKWEASSRHTRELEEVNRQKDQAVLAQQQQLEQKFIDLSTQSGNSLAEALRDQRQQLERDYNQHLQRADQSTEERISQLRELARLEVTEYKRELEAQYNTHKGQVQQLEADCAALERKLATTLKAFKLVFEYFTASKARTDFIMDDLIFIKRIATSCLNQIEQDDYRRLASLGIAPRRRRTFAGVATFILAVSRMHRFRRPQVPEQLTYEFERFMETKKVD